MPEIVENADVQLWSEHQLEPKLIKVKMNSLSCAGTQQKHPGFFDRALSTEVTLKKTNRETTA